MRVGVESMPTGVESISRPSLEENEIEATGVESISRPTFEGPEGVESKDHLEWCKTPGPDNRSDTFTKIRTGSDFTKGVEGLMVPLPNQGGMLK